MEDVIIRPAVLSDSAVIARLITQLGYPSTEAEMHDRMEAISADADHMTFVAEREGQVLGVIGVRVGIHYERSGRYGQILVLVTDETARSLGIGALLVAEGEQWLSEMGARVVVVTSGNHRVGAHKFYTRLGYDPTGQRFFKNLNQ